jgi:hypothetical protein
MRGAVYNLLIPNMAIRALLPAPGWKPVASLSIDLWIVAFSIVIFFSGSPARAADWSGSEQRLARKIVALTGPAAAALNIESRSSLGKRDTDIIGGGMRSALQVLGIRFVAPEQAAISISITLSENLQSYVWVAEVHRAGNESSIVIVSMARGEGPSATRDSMPLSIRRTPLWAQESRILDVAVLEEGAMPARIAVLDANQVSLYRLQGGNWQQEQTLALNHLRPWPRDLRGRLVLAKDKDIDKDHLLDAYLPGVLCRSSGSTPVTLTCRESDDPWPLVGGPLSLNAFYASSGNFFTGALVPGVGNLAALPKFYSAAFVPREKYGLWLFAAVDGAIHVVDGTRDRATRTDWGSDIANVRSSCGAGWQVLATISSDQHADSIRAFEFPDHDAVPVSAAADFNGEITALWTEMKGESAIAVVKNHTSGNYEAFRLAMDCSQ